MNLRCLTYIIAVMFCSSAWGISSSNLTSDEPTCTMKVLREGSRGGFYQLFIGNIHSEEAKIRFEYRDYCGGTMWVEKMNGEIADVLGDWELPNL